MAVMAPAPDQASVGLMRSTIVPLLYSNDAVGLSFSDLEANVEPAASLQYPALCQTLLEVQMSHISEQGFMVGETLPGCSSAPAMLESVLESSNNSFSTINLPHGSRAGSRGNHCGITKEMRIRGVMGRSSVAGRNLSVSHFRNTGNNVVKPGTGGQALRGVDAPVSTFTSQPSFAKYPARFTGLSVETGKHPRNILTEAGEIPTMFEVQASSSLEIKRSSACAASVQPELEAVEGITEAAMGCGTTPHELVEVAAAARHEKNYSKLKAEQHDFSRKESPGRSPSNESASHRNKRRKSDPASIDPKVLEDERSSMQKQCKGEAERGNKDTQEISVKFVEALESMGIPQPSQKDKEIQKPKEYPKQDYLYVRACRGQATDSHSLAERVRREKISKRMKCLQDLVPGCKKVTGKAVMLDEIINYVQSLQRQVEHLSMKLASVSSCNEDMTLERQFLIEREIPQTELSSILSTSSEANVAAFGLMQSAARQQARSSLLDGSARDHIALHSLGSGFDLTAFRCCTSTFPISRLADLARPMEHSFHNIPEISQFAGWDSEELQSVVERGLKYQTSRFGVVEDLHGHLRTGHTKVEY